MKAYCGGIFSVIPVLERLRQEGLEFEPRMDYINMILPLETKGAKKVIEHLFYSRHCAGYRKSINIRDLTSLAV